MLTTLAHSWGSDNSNFHFRKRRFFPPHLSYCSNATASAHFISFDKKGWFHDCEYKEQSTLLINLGLEILHYPSLNPESKSASFCLKFFSRRVRLFPLVGICILSCNYEIIVSLSEMKIIGLYIPMNNNSDFYSKANAIT